MLGGRGRGRAAEQSYNTATTFRKGSNPWTMSFFVDVGNEIHGPVSIDEVSSWLVSDRIGMYACITLSTMIVYDVGEI